MNTLTETKIKSALSFPTDWQAVQWHKAEKYVEKLQKRIFHAEKNGNKRKVRDLQRMLMKSKSALLLSIRRVTQINKGKRTAGVDGFIPSTSTETPPADVGDAESDPATEEPAESDAPEKKSNSAMYILIAVIALGGIAVGYYLKVLKPKRDGRNEEDDEDDEDEHEVVENDKDYEQEPDEPEDADYADFKDASEMGDGHEGE